MENEIVTRSLSSADRVYEQQIGLVRSFFQDWLGCVLAGLNAPKLKPLVHTVSPEALSENSQMQVSSLDKALVFGYAGHCLELDDSEFIGETHPSAALFATLTAQPRAEDRIDGLFRASIAGYLSLLSLGPLFNPSHYSCGWHGTGTLGALAATIARSHYDGLGIRQSLHALGLVSTLLSGTHTSFGSAAKYLNSGRAAQNSLLAVQLVQKGHSSNPLNLVGEKGLLGLLGGNELRPPTLSDNSSLSFVKAKKYPVCHCLEPVIENLNSLLLQNQVDVSRLVEVDLVLSPYSRQLLNSDRPKDRDQAFFSATYAVHSTLSNHPIDFSNYFDALDDFTSAPFRNIRVLVDENLAEMDHRICLGFESGERILGERHFDRGFERQDRSFVGDKFVHLVEPVVRSRSAFGELVALLDDGIELLSWREFAALLNSVLNERVGRYWL